MISLNYRDARPIYEQVRDGVRHLVVTGAIKVGEKLPSVRTMAARLAINPNTIQRAYTALEEEGYVSTTPGKGAFVVRGPEGGSLRRWQLLERFDALTAELLFLGTPATELALRISRTEERRGGGAK